MARSLSNCIYCDGRRANQPFSIEHIWPQALGGDSCPEVFRSKQVCRACNSLTGQWVDRAFLRNFFTSNERIQSSLAYLDPQNPSVLPLIFFGFDHEFPVQKDEVCERWLGPSGETIYHIHTKDDERWDTFAGGDVLKRKRDPGRVYFTITGSSTYWFLTAIKSILTAFPNIRPRCLAKIDGIDRDIGIRQLNEFPISDREKLEQDWISNRPSGMHGTKLVIDVGYADRFLAKIALGFSFTILGAKATFSPYGDELRKLLWSSDFSKRGDIAVRGSGPWSPEVDAKALNYIAWPGLWSLFFTQVRQDFALSLTTPSGKAMTMALSDDSSLWESNVLEQHRGGAVYFILPEQNRTFGPITMAELIGHRHGYQRHSQLSELQALRIDPAQLPDRERPADGVD